MDSVREATGFDFDVAPDVTETTPPTEARLGRIRERIAPKILTFYPEFAKKIWGLAA